MNFKDLNLKGGNQEESFEHCLNSDYKYKIFYKTGEEYIFDEDEIIDKFSAVRSIFIIQTI